MKMNFNNAIIRYTITKMAELAQSYSEPFDEHDKEAFNNNNDLRIKWEVYEKILFDAMGNNI